MNLTIRTRKGNYYTANLKLLLIPLLIFIAAAVVTVVLSVYQSNFDKIYAQTYDAILAREATVTVPRNKTAQNAVRSCAYSTPEIFTVDMIYYHNDDDTTTYTFTYNAYSENYQANLVLFNQYIKDIVASAPALSGDEEKVKWIHDYIITHYNYGGEHSALSMLQTGRGVCSAYTGLFTALAQEMGLSCGVAVSDAMAHTWNIVKVGKKWYHIDVTWDDDGDVAKYDYYLKTETEFLQLDHIDWQDAGKVLTSYDNLRQRIILIGIIALVASLLLTTAPLLINYLFK